jgi:glycine betaine catabolism B
VLRPKKVKKKFWSGELVVAAVTDETHDVKTFRFALPGGGALPFAHVAGQYLNIALMIDGKRVNRSYTIASSPARRDSVEISVKRVGYASAFLHDHVKQGDRIKIGAPAGKFVFAGHEAKRILLIAGGVGITPMMSVARSLTDRKWKGEIDLLFGVRELRDVIFAAELARLQSQFPNLRVEIVVSSERGRITGDMIRAFVPDLSCPIMLCGPDPMMTATRKILVEELGVPDAQVTQEAFVSPLQVVADAGALVAPGVGRVEFARAGVTSEEGDQTILECAEACGIDIPFECRSGICGQCKTKVVSGRVTMEVQDALTAADRSKGLVLACQARPAGDIVVEA